MSTEILLGIDVGTSGTKIVATDRDGRLLRSGSARYRTRIDDGAAEQDATEWWHVVSTVCPEVVGDATVLGVAVTSQAPTLVPVDRSGAALSPALTWLDRRATAEAELIADTAPGHRNGADPFFGTAKLPWLRRHRPEVSAHRVLTANGYITARLTDRMVLDDSSASLMQGFDEHTGSFDPRLAGLGTELLAEIVPSSEVIGSVTPAAAAVTGIPAGTPVAAGAVDAVGSALEAGVVGTGGPLVDMTGFSGVTVLGVPAATSVPGFIHLRHCVPGVDLLITAQVTAGGAVDWLNELTGDDADLRESAPLLARPRPSRVTTVPSLAGERTPSWNGRARGVIDGIDLTVDGIELMLSMLEGSALALATDVAALRAHGFPVDRLLGTGGGATSSAWLQIKADVLGVPVLRPRAGQGAAQGASYLAGLAVGCHNARSIGELASQIEARFLPDPAAHERYERRRPHFERLRALNAARTPEAGLAAASS